MKKYSWSSLPLGVVLSVVVLGLLTGCSTNTEVRVTPPPVRDFPSPVPATAAHTPTQPVQAPLMTPTLALTNAFADTSTPQVRDFATATPQAGVLEIKVGDYFFDPAIVTITVGTTVIWQAVGDLQHTIVPKDPPNAFPTGYTAGTGSPDVDWTATRPGTIQYHCDYHPGAMDAILIVVEEG
jgi:plastocyanin